jgi:hypothetical protein
MALQVKGWKKFQHFKDRRPPWIKLYREILDDPDWHELDGNSAKVLVMLWLVASEDPKQSGELPSMRKLSFRLHMKESELIKAIHNLKHWLIQDDIMLISDRYQLDAPETEGETYKEETETYKEERETDSCAEVKNTSAPAPDMPVMYFPIIGKEKQFPVYQKDIDEWQATFLGVDVIADLRKCRQWNKDNPARRKTKRGIRGHISAWLGKTQDSWSKNKPAKQDPHNEFDKRDYQAGATSAENIPDFLK